jgi:myo-inositol-1(or 4)-monophosphatase
LPDTDVDVDPAAAAIRLAGSVREAGELALSMFRTPLKQWSKGGSSPVSEADIAVDRLLRERLTAACPGVAWMSEESADDPSRLTARYVWIVDPIDGTRAFLAGLPDWTVSAALVENGRPIAACLFAPATDEFFLASANHGATCNGVPIAVTPGASLARARIAGPKSFVHQLTSVAPDLVVVPRVHSLALRLARVAQGTLDIAIAGANSHDWDLAAADLLVHEAGGALTHVRGGTVLYNQAELRHEILLAAGRERLAVLNEHLGNERLAVRF